MPYSQTANLACTPVRLNCCRRRRLIIRTACRVARVGPTTAKQFCVLRLRTPKLVDPNLLRSIRPDARCAKFEGIRVVADGGDARARCPGIASRDEAGTVATTSGIRCDRVQTAMAECRGSLNPSARLARTSPEPAFEQQSPQVDRHLLLTVAAGLIGEVAEMV